MICLDSYLHYLINNGFGAVLSNLGVKGLVLLKYASLWTRGFFTSM